MRANNAGDQRGGPEPQPIGPTGEVGVGGTQLRPAGRVLRPIRPADPGLDGGPEAGRLDLVEAPYDIVGLVEGVAELLAPRAQNKDLEIAASVAAGTPRMLVGDAARLRQILVNLTGNAIKFTEVGGVGLRVTAVGARLRIEVVDTGAGVPADRREAIFEDFEQADGSAARDSAPSHAATTAAPTAGDPSAET